MPQLARWLTFIEEFSFDVQHRVGTKHQNVDSLSRMPICDESLLDTEHRELRITAVIQQEDVDKPVGDLLAGANFWSWSQWDQLTIHHGVLLSPFLWQRKPIERSTNDRPGYFAF